MSRSSARKRVRERGLVEPIPALIAAAVVCAAVSLYAAVLYDYAPDVERGAVAPAADAAVDALTDDGVADPSRLAAAHASAPDGREANLTLSAGNRTWTAGPTPPDDAATTTRTVTVRVGPGQHRPGRLKTVIWT